MVQLPGVHSGSRTRSKLDVGKRRSQVAGVGNACGQAPGVALPHVQRRSDRGAGISWCGGHVHRLGEMGLIDATHAHAVHGHTPAYAQRSGASELLGTPGEVQHDRFGVLLQGRGQVLMHLGHRLVTVPGWARALEELAGQAWR